MENIKQNKKNGENEIDGFRYGNCFDARLMFMSMKWFKM